MYNIDIGDLKGAILDKHLTSKLITLFERRRKRIV